MNYKDYAKQNGHSEQKIEEMVAGLFGSNAEMKEIERCETHTSYDMGNGYILHANNSSADTVDLMDDGEILESWVLE